MPKEENNPHFIALCGFQQIEKQSKDVIGWQEDSLKKEQTCFTHSLLTQDGNKLMH